MEVMQYVLLVQHIMGRKVKTKEKLNDNENLC